MNIDNIIRKLLIKYGCFGKEVANTKFIENVDIGTAATDGSVVYYNPQFLEKLDVEQQVFILAHEICHIALNHILRSEGRDQRLWNIATDGVINAWLVHDGLKFVEKCINIPEAINMDAEELYDKLLKEQKDNNKEQDNNKQSSKSNGENKDDEQVGHDSHGMWKEAIEKKKHEGSGKSESNENNKENSSQSENNDQNEENRQDEDNSISEREVFTKNIEEKKEQLKKLRDELTGKSKQAGNGTDSSQFTMEDVGVGKKIVDWRRLLKENTRYKVGWSYQNASIENNVLMPNLIKKPYAETEILLDTSGSIDDELLRNFLRECKNILQVSRMKVGCFDTKFYGFTEIKSDKDINEMKFYGRGGTNFDVAVDAFSQRVDNKIIFTDGWANMPKKSVNAIWIVFGDCKINPPGGKVIYINESDLHKLIQDSEEVVRKR